MRNFQLLNIFLCIFVLTACVPPATSTSPPAVEDPGEHPADTGPPKEQILITSTSDSGPGTLRQALEDVQNDDWIVFDPDVFPPNGPATISIIEELPHIHSTGLVIDASNAGVILDGSQLESDWVAGLQIVDGEGIQIMGLQISHFSGPGISISGNSTKNIIGGDRTIGAGPTGQGNLISNNIEGISIATPHSSANVITGNLIGTDEAGADWLGNERNGVSIVENAHDNTIGPDNIIANNGNFGIVFEQSAKLGNTDIQNIIYDNGIGKGQPAQPVFFEMDLAAGTANGITCPNCMVEIFSTADFEGEIFEDQASANENGYFSVHKSGGFTGPLLTARAINTYNRTSLFSWPPVSGEKETLVLQEGNSSQRFALVAKSSQLLAKNHIGAWFEDVGRYGNVGFVYKNGFTRIRIGSVQGEGQGWMTRINAANLSEEVDKVISEYHDQGLEIVLILAAGAGIPHADGIFLTEAEYEMYLEYVGFVVSHFRGRIDAYEVWNEPGHMRPAHYAELVERTVPVIREADPDAKIIIGALQGNWDNGYPGYGEYQRNSMDLPYLLELIQTGVVDQVDGISWHPYYDVLFQDPYYQGYPNMIQGIKDLATAHGFTGEYYADEIMWTTVDEPNWDNGPPVSPLIAIKNYTRSITENRGLDINVTINTYWQVPYVEPIHNLADKMGGAEPSDLALSLVTVENAALRSYIFELPDGDYLVALWANDNAVEFDPGINATLTIPGIAASKVVGTDVLYGFEQELIFEIIDGDLVIENLLLKDYPTMIKLIHPTQ